MQTAALYKTGDIASGTPAERILMVVKNIESSSITTGLAVSLISSGTIDGINSAKAVAGNWKGFCGIAQADIPSNQYGLVTYQGYAASIQISLVGTSITVTAGDVLIPGAVAGTLFSSGTPQGMSTLLYRYAFVATTQTVSANPVWTDGVVKALL